MNILIDIGHPAHVHLLKNTAWQLKSHGHRVFYSVRDIPVAKRLMNYYNMPYIDLGEKKDNLQGKAWTVVKQDALLLRFVLKHKIDIGLSSGITLPQVSRVTKMKSIVFDDDDDEVEKLFVKYGHRFADTVLTPSCLRDHRKTKNAIFYNGNHELAYLHPDVFHPDESVLERLGIQQGEVYFVMRFVAMKGHHDQGQQGLTLEQKKSLVDTLQHYGKVIITAERELEREFEPYRMAVPAEDMHSVLYYSSLFIGDSQTMTSEASVLGVPALRCNSFAGRLSTLEEEEHQYGLTYAFTPERFPELMTKLKVLLDTANLKAEWSERRSKLLQDKINVSSFFTWFIESYPDSARIMKDDPDYQWNFK